MPPRWSRKPDRADADYRLLDDRMNFAVHVAVFAALNSGLWFFRLLGEKIFETDVPGRTSYAPWITSIWALILVAHAVFIFAIAKYDTTEKG